MDERTTLALLLALAGGAAVALAAWLTREAGPDLREIMWRENERERLLRRWP